MTGAINLYLSTLFGGAGVIVAVGVLVYVCAKACELVARWRHLRRLDRLWAEDATVYDWARDGYGDAA